MDKDVVALIRYIRELGIVDLGKSSSTPLVEGVGVLLVDLFLI